MWKGVEGSGRIWMDRNDGRTPRLESASDQCTLVSFHFYFFQKLPVINRSQGSAEACRRWQPDRPVFCPWGTTQAKPSFISSEGFV